MTTHSMTPLEELIALALYGAVALIKPLAVIGAVCWVLEVLLGNEKRQDQS